jgi:hypothetical protein
MGRPFPIGDILTVVTGRMVSPGGMGAVYGILNYLTGDNLYTHQLPRALDECRPWLLRWHPDLAAADASGVDATNLDGWLDEQVARFGAERDLEPIPADDHERIGPIEEAIRMVGPDRVIVVNPDDLA